MFIINSIIIMALILPVGTQNEYERHLKQYCYFSELVIEGIVQDVHLDSLQHFWGPNDNRYTWVTELNLSINKVWAGHFAENMITINIPGGIKDDRRIWEHGGHKTDFRAGDRMMVFLRYSPRLERWFTYVYSEYLLVDGEAYYTGYDYLNRNRKLHKYGEFWRILKRVTKRRGISGFMRSSDLVVNGKISKLDKHGFLFDVDEMYKGQLSKDVISVTLKTNVSIYNIGKKDRDLWGFYGPGRETFREDGSYILFLKKRGDDYYPFAGKNGVFTLDGENIYVNERVIPLKTKEVIQRIRKALKIWFIPFF